MVDLKKLKAAGICTIKGVEMITRKKMALIKVSNCIKYVSFHFLNGDRLSRV